MAYLMLFLALAVAVIVLIGLRMLIGLNLSLITTHELEQAPIAVPVRAQASRHR